MQTHPINRRSQSPLSRTCKSRQMTEISPTKINQKSHTVYHEDKLKVFIKFKPKKAQTNDNLFDNIRYLSQTQVKVQTSLKKKVYIFDHVFDSDKNHKQIFDLSCKQMIDNVFAQTFDQKPHNNGLIFVYGNTGTGKTYTMGLLDFLHSSSFGIVPDAINYIFSTKKRRIYDKYEISLSFCEIYMDQIYDLLDFDGEKKLTIRQDTKTKQPYLENETVIIVNSPDQAFQLLNIGLEKRRVAEQKMNRKSSRGHGVITVYLNHLNGEKPGKLCFIDLAGCQRLKQSESKGSTFNEALHINSSLSALQTLLMSISDQNIRNYRASKLTRMLQPYIQFGKIQLFVTTTSQSLNAIQFAKRCKGIKFMQRQQNPVTSRKSKIVQKNFSQVKVKQSKQNAQFAIFRKESTQREKKLLLCITSLIGMIDKISKTLRESLEAQTVHSNFSFSDVIKNLQIQTVINNKINNLQNQQESMIEESTKRLAQNNLSDFVSLLKEPFDFIKKLQQHTFGIVEVVKKFGILAEYKNVYKKQYFTSELKSSLLENKNKSFEEAINYLVKQQNIGTDRRVAKKLKDIGVLLTKDMNRSISPLKRNQNQKENILSAQKRKSTPRDLTCSQNKISINEIHNRSAIYIDEV